MAGFYKSFKEFQDYYANKFQRNNPLPWQDGMQAIIWWITENIPENTQATITISSAPTGVEISGKGIEDDPYIWAFNFNIDAVKGPKGDTGATGPQGPQGPQGEQGPAGQDGQDGTIVEANPVGTALEDLTKISIGGTVYDIPSGGGSSYYLHEIYIIYIDPEEGIPYQIKIKYITDSNTPLTINDIINKPYINGFLINYADSKCFDITFPVSSPYSGTLTIAYRDANWYYDEPLTVYTTDIDTFTDTVTAL